MSTPLDGLRVVDLSNTLSGAQATQLLADYGAEVVHVEPVGGSPLRAHPGYPFWGRGKLSIELDLKDPADKGTARDLLLGSDVALETFRPGVVERLGLGYDQLNRDNPRLVYASITGFGRTGPYSHVKGYEALVLAKLGVFHDFRHAVARPGPAFVSTPYAAFSAAHTALHGILAALVERERSGAGQRVDTSLVQGFAALDPWAWFLHLVGQRFPEAYVPVALFADDGQPNGPFVYTNLVGLTADGRWLHFAQNQPHLLRALMSALGLETVLTDPKWAGFPSLEDAERRTELWGLMLQAVRGKTLQEWTEVFDRDHDVWAEPFRNGPGVLDHPQLRHDHRVTVLDDAERGPVRQPGRLVDLHDQPLPGLRTAPRRDADSAALRARATPTAWPAPATDTPSGLPLEGVTILELASLYAAPYGATQLADLGARVIKVEPLTGDPIRWMLPFPEAGGAKVVQGKHSIAVDVTTDDGRAIVHALARRCDVVLQSFRAGVAERLGLDAATLTALNPELVYLNAPGYGNDGPCGHRPAFATSIGAAGGIGRRNIADSVPEHADLSLEEVRQGCVRLAAATTTMTAQADGFSAVAVATALLLGVLTRTRAGRGGVMTTTMLATTSHAISDDVVDYAAKPTGSRGDTDLLGLHALYRLYEAADGWIFLAAPEPADWDALVAALAPDIDLGGDARFTPAAARRANDAALATVLSGIFSAAAAADWEKRLTAGDVGCVTVSTETPEAVLMSRDFGRAGHFVVDVEHPVFDRHPRLAPLVTFSRSATRAEPGCLTGQHTDAILGELGYARDDIADLRTRAVIG